MLLNNIKLTLRILKRNYFFTLINIIGLALGFASFYALGEYAVTELRSDQYHADHDHIARLGVNWSWTDNGGKTWGHVQMGYSRANILPQIKDEFPEVESYVRILNQPMFKEESANHGTSIVISPIDKRSHPRIFNEDKIVYADPNLFTFFSIPLIHGKPEEVLREARYVVLSYATARRYFDDEDPTGQLLKLNDSTTLRVSGVFKDLPHNSHLDFELVISDIGLDQKWQATVVPTTSYVKLRHNDFAGFAEKLNTRKDYWADILKLYPDAKLSMFVQPLTDIAFSKNFDGDYFTPKSKTFLLTLVFIAFSILIMAWVNYVNLSVSRIKSRLNEIGTRKASGAGAWDIVKQFITESFIITVLSLLLSVGILSLCRQVLSDHFSIEVTDFRSLSIYSWMVYFLIILTGILISGLYPALISIAHQPRTLFVLARQSTRKRILPSLLTVGQIVLAIIFIVLGFTVSLQLNHILNMETGISKAVIIVEAPVIKPLNYFPMLHSLKGQIERTPHVTNCAISHFAFDGGTKGAGYTNLKRIGGDHVYGMDLNVVDEDFVSVYGIRLVAGRNFVEDELTQGIMVSRLAAERIGFRDAQEAIGAKVSMSGIHADVWNDVQILGVFEDFQVTSLLNLSRTDAVGRGIVLTYAGTSSGAPERISMRVASNHRQTMQQIQSLFEKEFPGNAFVWYFLNEKVNQLYGSEQIARNQIILFTALSLFVVCLGLLGMISNKAVEKTKELGIRKVLGARVHHPLEVLLNALLKQLGAATLLGIPVAWYLTNEYLQNFSARISLQWWRFTLSVAILVLVLLATIGTVLWKAASRNPLEALKHD